MPAIKGVARMEARSAGIRDCGAGPHPIPDSAALHPGYACY